MTRWDASTQRGRWWLSYDLRSIVLPRIVMICEGDYRLRESRSLEVGVQLRAGYSDPVVSVAVDLVDHPLERPIAATYWAIKETPGRIRNATTDALCLIWRAADSLRRMLT